MRFKRRIAIATAALSFAAVGLLATPVEARAKQCLGADVTVQGTDANETFHLYADRIEIHRGRTVTTVLARDKRFISRQKPYVIDTGTGDDTITSHGNINFVACFQRAANDGTDYLNKPGGDANVEFYGRANFTATGGDNDVTVYHSGSVRTGAGDDEILFGRHGSARTGAGNDHIVIGNRGWVWAGDGDDFVQVFGRAWVYGGAGNDEIQTGGWDDFIETGPGMDTVNAGYGTDSCDSTPWGPTWGDTYENCELIYPFVPAVING